MPRWELSRPLPPHAIFFLNELPPSTPNFEETPTVAIEQRRAAEATIDGVNETIDSMTNTAVFSRCRPGP